MQHAIKNTIGLRKERLQLISRYLGRHRKEKMRSVTTMKSQFGIEFPAPSSQEHILIARANLTSSNRSTVKQGLLNLCSLMDSIDKGIRRMQYLDSRGIPKNISLWEYCFTSTLGFGNAFFVKLGIPKSKRPSGLKEMPSNTEMGDPSPYVLSQTDLILQLSSSRDYVNRWVLENSFEGTPSGLADKSSRIRNAKGISENHDIVSAIKGWAIITDVHYGFQRTDGRNLMGFNDGISNIRRFSPDFLNTVWISKSDRKNARYAGGTFMVFQKIEHDIEQWNRIDVKTQEEWVGRSKYTGLLLGTLTEDEDRELFKQLSSPDATIRKKAERKWKKLIDEQRDPKIKFYSDDEKRHRNIPEECPAWSHVRKANPRQHEGAPMRLLFRRGYLFSDLFSGQRASSGLLFVSFQKDILNTFESIKKEWLNNNNFPVPGNVKNRHRGERKWFDENELEYRHRGGRFTKEELLKLSADQREVLGLAEDEDFREAVEEASCHSHSNDTKNGNSLSCGLHDSGREGLSGPSENGVKPNGSLIATIPLGGGYYFIPPVPKEGIQKIGQLFF